MMKTTASSLLSEASYRELRFEGARHSRPRLSSTMGWAWGAHSVAAEEVNLLSSAEEELVAATLGSAGLVWANYRNRPIQRRLPALLRALQAATPADALRRLADNPVLASRALNTLLIGHTLPFRDVDVFDTLRQLILPHLARQDKLIRVWSVGCSTGEELISVALLLAECRSVSRCVLRGSDCRPAAIDEARCQGQALWSEVPPQYAAAREKVSRDEFAAWLSAIEWRVEDILTSDAEHDWNSGWDLILCRNMAIYLEPVAATALWEKLHRCLTPGGILVTGKAERPGGSLPFHRITKCIYQREEPSP
jgi:chemotaxis methyl-accepting protein methylase